MPVGNGDIGLNVWVEADGSLDFYIGKTDSWNQQGELFKVGGVHIAMNPSPLAAGTPFAQVLKLHEGEIDIKEGTGPGEVDLRVWVDANHPVIRVESKSAQPISYSVTLNDWRKEDVTSAKISPDPSNAIVWYHRNPANANVVPLLANLTFGAVMKGPGPRQQKRHRARLLIAGHLAAHLHRRAHGADRHGRGLARATRQAFRRISIRSTSIIRGRRTSNGGTPSGTGAGFLPAARRRPRTRRRAMSCSGSSPPARGAAPIRSSSTARSSSSMTPTARTRTARRIRSTPTTAPGAAATGTRTRARCTGRGWRRATSTS